MLCGSSRSSDAFLASVLDLLSSTKFTVIYTTTPPNADYQPAFVEPESYEMDAQSQMPVHMDLKRDFSNNKRASDGNITLPDGPLFERYQYLSPGTFPSMGRVVEQYIDNSVQAFSWVYSSLSSLYRSSMSPSMVLPASKSLMPLSTKRWVPRHRRSNLSNVCVDCKITRWSACIFLGARNQVDDGFALP